MLQDIRERAQGWIAWFIVILISVPFALWGIQEYLGVGSEPVVASVNGQEITERQFDKAYREFRQRLQQQLGSSYRPELIDEAVLRKEVLETMIRDRLTMQAADSLGLGASDSMVRAAIQSMQPFQVAGSFSRDAYDRRVRSMGFSNAGFEGQLRQEMVTNQLASAVTGSSIATDAEVAALLRLQLQKRELAYLVIPVENYLHDAEVSELEARAYYDENRNAFMAPERVKVEYLELDVASIAKTLSVDEALLQGYFEQHKGEYQSPEQRRASHILITVDQGADEMQVQAARAQAMVALQRVRAGEDFAAVAKSLSQDPGSADLGGDLGYFETGVMDPAFDAAVAGLLQDEVSEPVRSAFGFHIIKLTAVRPAAGKSFDEVRDRVREVYLRSEAERLFYEYAERLSDLAYEDPGSLQPAAEALGMGVRESDWFGREGGSGAFASPRVAGAAFGDDVLLQGHNSEALELGPEHILVLRVLQHEEAAIRPFEAVKEEILASLKQQKAAEASRNQGRELIARLREGVSLQQLADDLGLKLIDKGSVQRSDRTVPAAVLTSLFKIPKPQQGGRSYGEAVLDDGDFAVIALGEVQDGNAQDAAMLGGDDALKQALSRSRGEAYFRHLVQNLRDSADVSFPQREN